MIGDDLDWFTEMKLIPVVAWGGCFIEIMRRWLGTEAIRVDDVRAFWVDLIKRGFEM